MKFTSIFGPDINHHFNKNLLSVPTPKCCDDSETLWKIYTYIKLKLIPRAKNERQLSKVLDIEKLFLELYERIQKEEEKLKAETGTANKGPFYYFNHPVGHRRRIYDRLKKASYKTFRK